jgi:outer membrane protein assembly factor BamD (BamD/ComL family)
MAGALALTGLLSTQSPAVIAAAGQASPDVRAAQLADARERADEAQARAAEAKEREAEREAARRDREERLYEEGQEAIEEARWQRAIERFSLVAAAKSARADAALYWRAYSLDKLGQKAEALATVAELVKDYPKSRWMSDARALEMQVRQSAGQPVRPEAEADEELKLLALQALQHSNPEQAVPMLEKILQGNQSPRMKDRALFVLAQSQSARARQVLADIARGGGNPDLQRRAIQYLGVHGTRENRELLAQIYAASSDVDIKRRILRAFMVSGERARVLAAATSETSAELRAEAVQQLGVMGAHDELWQLYQKEAAVDVKKRIINAMFVGGNSTRLVELANNESNVELRRAAIRSLGLMGRSRTGEALLALYNKEKDVNVKKDIIQGFFHQNNAEQLVAIARKETDPALRKAIVSQLSHMTGSKVALDYLMEILNKP